MNRKNLQQGLEHIISQMGEDAARQILAEATQRLEQRGVDPDEGDGSLVRAFLDRVIERRRERRE